MRPFSEHTYGASKYAVELDLEAAYRKCGQNYVVLRQYNVYGDSLQTRAFSHVDDVGPIIAQSVRMCPPL